MNFKHFTQRCKVRSVYFYLGGGHRRKQHMQAASAKCLPYFLELGPHTFPMDYVLLWFSHLPHEHTGSGRVSDLFKISWSRDQSFSSSTVSPSIVRSQMYLVATGKLCFRLATPGFFLLSLLLFLLSSRIAFV